MAPAPVVATVVTVDRLTPLLRRMRAPLRSLAAAVVVMPRAVVAVAVLGGAMHRRRRRERMVATAAHRSVTRRGARGGRGTPLLPVTMAAGTLAAVAGDMLALAGTLPRLLLDLVGSAAAEREGTWARHLTMRCTRNLARGDTLPGGPLGQPARTRAMRRQCGIGRDRLGSRAASKCRLPHAKTRRLTYVTMARNTHNTYTPHTRNTCQHSPPSSGHESMTSSRSVSVTIRAFECDDDVRRTGGALPLTRRLSLSRLTRRLTCSAESNNPRPAGEPPSAAARALRTSSTVLCVNNPWPLVRRAAAAVAVVSAEDTR